MTSHEDLTSTLDAWMGEARARLEALVRIPSVSFPGHDPAEVRRSAAAVVSLLEEVGLDGVRLLELGDDVHPYVYGEWLGAGVGAPTVLLYAHHDVQPVATANRWTSPPFEPVERDGRLYGRGVADDKAGVLVHAVAVKAWLGAVGTMPVNVKVVIEGEEEIGSPHLASFLEAHRDLLSADVIVLTDVSNWKVGWPALTSSLRGIAEVHVTVRALEQPVHSGMWGGPVPDALTGLVRLLATLHDADGAPAVDGFDEGVRSPTEEERRRMSALDEEVAAEARLLPGVRLVGSPEVPVLERLWNRPTITVVGVDAPSVREASNQLVAEAGAKLSMRMAPGQDPAGAIKAVVRHLEVNVPWGLHLECTAGAAVPAWATEPEGPAFEAAAAAMETAYGRAPALIGCGATIPFVQPFSDALGGAPCLLTGIEDPATNAHGEDESLHLADFRNACLAEALLFSELADRL